MTNERISSTSSKSSAAYRQPATSQYGSTAGDGDGDVAGKKIFTRAVPPQLDEEAVGKLEAIDDLEPEDVDVERQQHLPFATDDPGFERVHGAENRPVANAS